MEPLVECVPNISEGRNGKTIDAVASAVTSVPGVKLLDIDPGEDTNRTVFTFAGAPEPVLEAAFRVMETARKKIDMTTHRGAHPRMGAVDVCPFVPVAGITLEECAELARRLGRRVGEELGLPVFLYGEAAARPERRRLPDIREGEYEALKTKLKNPDFVPDFGPARFIPPWGATAVGARDFLLAYNVNLNTRNLALARDIALSVRERGRARRDKNNAILRDDNGKPLMVPGRLRECQAAGWYIDRYGCAQVTMNLTKYRVSGLHHGFDAVEEEARLRGLRVTGSEIVGLVPKRALLDAGVHYLERAGLNPSLPEKEILHTAILSLGLNDTVPFNAEEKIIEEAVGETRDRLIHMSLAGFTDALSTGSPAPGGGSASAVSLGLSAALTSMVAHVSYDPRKNIRTRDRFISLAREAQAIKNRALALTDADTDGFNRFLEARRLPGESKEEKELRRRAMQDAARHMTQVPLETLELSVRAAELAEQALKNGKPATASDAGSALSQARAAATGAFLNVMINLPSVEDSDFTAETEVKAAILRQKTETTCRRALKLAAQRSGHGN
jgi:glutamate formiminotransferase / formiminotetrahydrofolate cyclodeaminase